VVLLISVADIVGVETSSFVALLDWLYREVYKILQEEY